MYLMWVPTYTIGIHRTVVNQNKNIINSSYNKIGNIIPSIFFIFFFFEHLWKILKHQKLVTKCKK